MARQELEQLNREWSQAKDKMRPEVSEEDIAKIVSQWTGIPIFRLEEKESEKLLKIEEELHKRVVGQDEAIGAIAHAVRRSRAGIKDPKRPIGSFIFLGPTGVGKTLLPGLWLNLCLAMKMRFYNWICQSIWKNSMSPALSALLPDMSGYEEGGQLTEKVRRRPYAVILLDEIEKAHPDVFNLLFRYLKTAGLPIVLAEKWILGIP